MVLQESDTAQILTYKWHMNTENVYACQSTSLNCQMKYHTVSETDTSATDEC